MAFVKLISFAIEECSGISLLIVAILELLRIRVLIDHDFILMMIMIRVYHIRVCCSLSAHLAIVAALIGGADTETREVHTPYAGIRIQMCFQVTL